MLMKEWMLTPSSTWSWLGIFYSSLLSSSTLGLDYHFNNAAMHFLTQRKLLGLHKLTESTWQESFHTLDTCVPWHFRWCRIFWTPCDIFLLVLMLEKRAIHPTWMFEFNFAKGTTYTIYMLLLCLCNSATLERICFSLLLHFLMLC